MKLRRSRSLPVAIPTRFKFTSDYVLGLRQAEAYQSLKARDLAIEGGDRSSLKRFIARTKREQVIAGRKPKVSVLKLVRSQQR